MRRIERTALHASRFSRILARDSIATELLQGCPVVTAAGMSVGHVDTLLIDRSTRQLRYVTVSRDSGGASVSIPWHALYFDSALARLVFFTYS